MTTFDSVGSPQDALYETTELVRLATDLYHWDTFLRPARQHPSNSRLCSRQQVEIAFSLDRLRIVKSTTGKIVGFVIFSLPGDDQRTCKHTTVPKYIKVIKHPQFLPIWIHKIMIFIRGD